VLQRQKITQRAILYAAARLSKANSRTIKLEKSIWLLCSGTKRLCPKATNHVPEILNQAKKKV
jgi:hypothetical protein